MDDNNGYAVYFFPKALTALGEAIKPYLQKSKGGTHVVCREIDTGGSLIEMTLDARTTAGETVQLELMVPTSMVLMIVSARTDEAFGFGPRIAVEAAAPAVDDGSKAQVEVEASSGAAVAPSGEAGTASKKTRKVKTPTDAPQISRSKDAPTKRKSSKK